MQRIHYAAVEKGGWLGQTYTTCSGYAGGYIHIQKITPLALEGGFCFDVVVNAPDYNAPLEVTCMTDGAFKAPILSAQ